MRVPYTCRFTVLLALPATLALEYSPFIPPYNNGMEHSDGFSNVNFLRRDSKCVTFCSSMGDSKVCCGNRAVCALDQVGNVACCPFDSVCTGTISVSGAAPTGTPVTGSSAAAPTATMTHAISGSSTVANSYYPYPYLPTTYPNAADCSTSFSSCQAESAKCTGFVEGGGYGVTVSGAGGIITQQGAMAPASAQSICSSLSQEACHGLQLTQCSTLGGEATSSSAGGSFIVGGNSNAAPTRCAALYGMGLGVAVGLAGQVVG